MQLSLLKSIVANLSTMPRQANPTQAWARTDLPESYRRMFIVIACVVVVAPIFERSYAMFRSFIGTWIPFAATFPASLAAGILVLALERP